MADLYMGSPLAHLQLSAPELAARTEFIHQAMRELSARGLTDMNSLGVAMSGEGTKAKHTTALGDLFVTFISDPDTGI